MMQNKTQVLLPRHRSLLALGSTLTLLALTTSANAQVTTYSSLAAFQVAAPVTILEDFSGGNLNNASIGPLDITSNDGVFTPGSIENGLRLNFSGISPNQYFYSHFFGFPFGITTNFSHNSMDLIFYNNDVNAVGFDFSDPGGSPSYTITVFDTSGGVLSTSMVSVAGTAFFGAISTSGNIGRINLDTLSFETVANVRFGSVGAAAPEPGTFALLALGGIGILAKRRQKKIGII